MPWTVLRPLVDDSVKNVTDWARLDARPKSLPNVGRREVI